MNQQQNQVNINPNDTTAIVCEECGHESFRPIVFLRKISRFVSPDGNEHVWPVDSMECTKCLHVNKDMNPLTNINTQENGKD